MYLEMCNGCRLELRVTSRQRFVLETRPTFQCTYVDAHIAIYKLYAYTFKHSHKALSNHSSIQRLCTTVVLFIKSIILRALFSLLAQKP